MPTARRSLARRLAPGVAALSALALVGSGLAVAVGGHPATTPAPGVPPTASLPDGTVNTGPCGGAVLGTRTCDLTATTGTVTLPGALSVPIWGFSPTLAAAAGSATIPGPTLIALTTETITIHVTNNLPAGAGNLSIQVPTAVTASPDHTGAAPGGVATWTGSGLKPGTYIYEAGPTVNGQRQVAMGVTGMLIVRPADYEDQLTLAASKRYALTGSAANGCMATGASGFTAEATVAVNEINPEFNANPLHFGLAPYEPKFFLINGKAFDATTPTTIDVAQGDCLLLRYANLGNQEHSMGMVGARQTVIARDSRALSNPRNLDAEFTTPGQTSDALVQISADTHSGDEIPLIDLGRRLHNDTDTSLGGAAVMVRVVADACAIDTTLCAPPVGPAAQVVVTPTTSDGIDPIHVVITAPGAVSALYWIDTMSGSGTSASLAPGGFDIVSPVPGLLDGDHIVWVQASDATNPGASAGDVFTLNLSGPIVYALSVDPPVTNGTTLNKTPNTLPAVSTATFTAGTPNIGTLDFSPALHGLNLGDPINLSGFTPASWNGNFTVSAVVSPSVVQFSLGTATPGNASIVGTVMGGIAGASGDVIVTGTAEPSLADRSISTVDWCVLTAPTICSVLPSLNGTIDYFDPAAGPPPQGSPVAIEIRIPAADLAGLGENTYQVQLTASETLYDWSALPLPTPVSGKTRASLVPATTPVVVDLNGPVASITEVNPAAFGLDANIAANLNYFPSERVTAHLTDVSDIKNAELFITAASDPVVPGSVGSPWVFGGGTQMTPVNSVWAGMAMDVQSDIPAAEFTAFDQGTVKLWVHGQDAAGNWGPLTPVCSAALGSSCYSVTLDRTPPVELSGDSTKNPTTPVADCSAVVPAVPVPTGVVAGSNGCWDPIVLNPIANPATPTDPVGTLDLWGQDPLLPPIHPATWLPLSTKIVAVEWFLSYRGVVDGDQLHDQLANVFLVPDYNPNEGPVHISMPIVIPPNEGQPPLNSGAQIVYRLRDAAGNYSQHYAALIIP